MLRADIGIDWPQTDPTVVQEAVSRSAGGYAGLFDPADRRIEVAYWADPLVALHEAAHGWFNGSLLADRWSSEGFASLYGERAGARLKQKDTSPKLTASIRKSAIPLNAWAGLEGDAADADRATEAYGYAASLALARAIAERAGDDGLRALWSAAAGRVAAYQPPSIAGDGTAQPWAPETVDGPPDWRRLLDLLEDGTGTGFADLWQKWVVRSDEASLLDARAAARTAYTRTLAVAGDWTLPRSIRDALRDWKFDVAQDRMADARTVIAQWGAIEALATRTGVTPPPTMRQRFEAGDFAGASAEAEGERNALLAIGEAAATRPAGDDLLSRVGMLGEDPDADIGAARSALAAGDLAAAQSASRDATRAWTGAWQEGRRRVLLGLAAIASMLVLVAAVAGRARAARRGRASSARAGS